MGKLGDLARLAAERLKSQQGQRQRQRSGFYGDNDDNYGNRGGDNDRGNYDGGGDDGGGDDRGDGGGDGDE